MRIAYVLMAVTLGLLACAGPMSGGTTASEPTATRKTPSLAGDQPSAGGTQPATRTPAPSLPRSSALPCPLFPPDNIWNTPIDALPRHLLSDEYVATIGRDTEFHADFGAGIWPPEDGGPIGIPYVVVSADQPGVAVSFDYDDESDPGPYPVPPEAPIEGGPQSDGDRHILIVQEGTCRLYELYDAWPRDDGGWDAGSGAIYDLRSHALRPAGWTSADAAGLPILPGLVRYDEVAAGHIDHAIRITFGSTRRGFVLPATHFASSITDVNAPAMGQRLRLKAGYDISRLTGQARVIAVAMQNYGVIVADNGSNWFFQGAPDPGWVDDDLNQLKSIPGSAFEAVDTGPVRTS